jgi:hypothetical protein
MTINLGWINRVLSTQSAVKAAVEEIERTAVRGLPSPGSTAQAMTPLSSEQWAPLQDGLSQIIEEMDALTQSLAPRDADQSRQRQPLAATRYQISVALLMLEEQVIDDLDPARVRGFGKLDTQDEERLTVSVARLRARVRSLREYVENLTV